MSGFYTWSPTAASNASADSAINWAEGQSPSSVNNSARGMMASTAKWRDDISGALLTDGTSTAYTVASNQGFDTLAHMDGAMVAFTPHATNGATVTLNVDGLGGKPLRSAPGVDLPAAVLIEGGPYVATYYNAAGEFILQGFHQLPEVIPVGGCIPYLGTTVPNSNFAFPYGQTFSRSVYAKLFTLVGTTFGSGDGSTTFTGPDVRGRAFFGLDNMGGTAAGRITTASSAIDGATLGAAGGAQAFTLLRSQLPNVSPSFSGAAGTVTVTSTNTVPINAIGTTAGDSGAIVAANGSGNLISQGSFTPSGVVQSLNGNVTQQGIVSMPPAFICPVIMRII